MSIPDYVEYKLAGKKIDKTTPLDISKQIHDNADKALQILKELKPENDKELAETLQDIKTIAYLGKYYAHKIHGATSLELFRKSKKQVYQQEAVRELVKAAKLWRLYGNTALKQYKNPLWTNRVGYVDFKKLYKSVLGDIETAGGKIPENLKHFGL